MRLTNHLMYLIFRCFNEFVVVNFHVLHNQVGTLDSFGTGKIMIEIMIKQLLQRLIFPYLIFMFRGTKNADDVWMII